MKILVYCPAFGVLVFLLIQNKTYLVLEKPMGSVQQSSLGTFTTDIADYTQLPYCSGTSLTTFAGTKRKCAKMDAMATTQSDGSQLQKSFDIVLGVRVQSQKLSCTINSSSCSTTTGTWVNAPPPQFPYKYNGVAFTTSSVESGCVATASDPSKCCLSASTEITDTTKAMGICDFSFFNQNINNAKFTYFRTAYGLGSGLETSPYLDPKNLHRFYADSAPITISVQDILDVTSSSLDTTDTIAGVTTTKRESGAFFMLKTTYSNTGSSSASLSPTTTSSSTSNLGTVDVIARSGLSNVQQAVQYIPGKFIVSI
jgi:hypothetical protein